MALSEVRRGPGLKNRNFSDTAGLQLHKIAHSDKFFYTDGKGRWNGCQSDGTVASEVTAEINYLTDGRGNQWEKLNIGTQVSGFPFPAPTATLATGTNLAVGNQTSAEGAEFVPGGNTAGSPVAFTIGTHAFYMQYKVRVEDVGGVDLWLGFHTVATLQAIPTGYDDYAAILYDGTASTVNSTTKTQYDVNNAGPTTSASLFTVTADDTNGVELTGEMFVSLGGQVSWKFNGQTSTSAPLVNFTAGDVVVPFIAYLNTADVAGAVILQELAIGTSDSYVANR
jgi:hypothetical protein